MLLLLFACFERLVVDVRVDARHQIVQVVSVAQSSDRPGEEECATVEACMGVIRAECARSASDLVAAGAVGVRTGVAVRGEEIDFIERYEAPLASALFGGDSVVQRLTLTDQRGREKGMAGIVVFDDPKETRTVVTANGRFERLAAASEGEVWLFRRGRGLAHVEVTVLDGEGKDAQIEPWIGRVPGLPAAILASDLVLDPASL